MLDRLLAGEEFFLPNATWVDVKNGGGFYHAVRRAGRYIHFRQAEGGIRVWVDDIPSQRPHSTRTRLWTDAKVVR